MEPARFRIRDAEDPSDARARADSENGERRTECGERRTEYGERSTEFVLRNGFLHSLRASVRDWDGACEIPDSRCGRSFGREGSSSFGVRRTECGERSTEYGVNSDFVLRTSFFGLDSFPAPETTVESTTPGVRPGMTKSVAPQGVEPDRRAIAINGIVQGVGFRPYVYGLATRFRLRGLVKNGNGDVPIEVEGEPHSLDRFRNELTAQPPPLARIDELRWSSRPVRGDPARRIESSERDLERPI